MTCALTEFAVMVYQYGLVLRLGSSDMFVITNELVLEMRILADKLSRCLIRNHRA